MSDDVSGDRMVRMSAEARTLLPELWRGLPMERRDVLAAMVDDYDADALPSEAERWQQVRERLEVARLHIDETARSLFSLDGYADAVAARSAVMAAWKIAMNGIHGVHSWPTT
jgi:hypothetical protein